MSIDGVSDLEREREEQDRTEDEVNGLRRDRDAIHGHAAGINKNNDQARALLNDLQRGVLMRDTPHQGHF
jgi:hypothetical protein